MTTFKYTLALLAFCFVTGCGQELTMHNDPSADLFASELNSEVTKTTSTNNPTCACGNTFFGGVVIVDSTCGFEKGGTCGGECTVVVKETGKAHGSPCITYNSEKKK